MSIRSRDTVPPALSHVHHEFERWRSQHGGPGIPLPEHLWTEAVRVARSEGAAATAQALRINRHRLEERLARVIAGGSTAITQVGAAAKDARFIELPAAPLGVGVPTRTVARFESGDGKRLEVEVEADRLDLIIGLAMEFWRGGR